MVYTRHIVEKEKHVYTIYGNLYYNSINLFVKQKNLVLLWYDNQICF